MASRGYEEDGDDYYDDGGTDEYDDYDLIDEHYDRVASKVPKSVTEDAIVAALRAHKYNAEKAIAALTPKKAAGASHPPVPLASPGSGGGGGGQGKGKAGSVSASGGVPLSSPPLGTVTKTAHSVSSAGGPPPSTWTVTSVGAAVPLPPIPAEVAAGVASEKPSISIVTLGHVDAGKSTLMGHLLYDMGCVATRTLAKYVKDARSAGKASFAFAWVLDEEASERERGVTMDVGVNHFHTATRSFTLLDAPGHRDFVPNTITAIAQADAAVLVLDATPDEYEMSVVGGGQAKEHILLARNFGITSLVVAVNKMDGRMVAWSQARFDAIVAHLTPILLAAGFKADNVTFVPVSGLTGVNLVKDPHNPANWTDGAGVSSIAATAPSPSSHGGGAGGGGASLASSQGGHGAVGRDGASEDIWARDGDVAHGGRHDDIGIEEMLEDLGLAGFGGGGGVGATGPALSRAASGGGDGGEHDVTTAMRQAWTREATERLTCWYTGPTLLAALEAVKPPSRMLDKPLRLSISDVYKSGSHGLTVAGRVEGGYIQNHMKVVPVPGTVLAMVKGLRINGVDAAYAAAGDNVDVLLGGMEEGSVRPGHVLCWPSHPIHHVSKFKAQIAVFGALDMPIVPGQQFMLHSHTVEEPCNITRILRTVDREGHTVAIKPRALTANNVAIVRIRTTRPICLDTFVDHRRLGRFMLRYSSQTVAAGMVLKVKVGSGT